MLHNRALYVSLLLEIYAGVILFNDLYVNTALFYLSHLSTDNHPSSVSIPADGVLICLKNCSRSSLL